MRDTFESTGPEPRRLTGGHVLAIFLGFFALVFAVNGYFLVAALSTHGGVVAVEPYRKGLAYNQRIAADERQTALGWHDQVKISGDGSLAISFSDRDNRPISNLVVSGTIGRPTTSADDRSLRTAETAPGEYAATVGTLTNGSWIVTAEARQNASDAEPAYRLRRRVWLKP